MYLSLSLSFVFVFVFVIVFFLVRSSLLRQGWLKERTPHDRNSVDVPNKR